MAVRFVFVCGRALQSCIGMKFSIIEIKMFIFVLVTNFKFAPCDKVGKANVCVSLLLLVGDIRTDLSPVFSVLTRPYVMGKHKEGSQCPLFVIPLAET